MSMNQQQAIESMKTKAKVQVLAKKGKKFEVTDNGTVIGWAFLTRGMKLTNQIQIRVMCSSKHIGWYNNDLVRLAPEKTKKTAPKKDNKKNNKKSDSKKGTKKDKKK